MSKIRRRFYGKTKKVQTRLWDAPNKQLCAYGQQLCEERIIMAVDEYETIRLIDLACYTQEECAAQMGIARTTVQGIYNDARRKLADALVNGKMLFIEGGDIDICERENAGCGRKCGQLCRKEMKDEKNKRNLGDEFDE